MPSFHVHRSTEINASPDKVFDAVADFSTWTTWSPWLCAEPDAEVHVTADSSSVGSIYSWKGEVVGEGEIEHQELSRGKLIEDEIRFVKPFRSQSRVSFALKPAGDDTKITWHMRGSLPWFLFWMRPQMEVLIGMDYERGLKMLKEWVETGRIRSETKTRGVEPVGPIRMAGVRINGSLAEIGPAMEAAFAEATRQFDNHKVASNGVAMSVYHKFDMKARTFDCTTGFMVCDSQTTLPTQLSLWTLPRTGALVVEHIGSYDHLGNAWSAAYQTARYKKLKQSKVGTFEIYRNDPNATPTEELRTEICLPLKKTNHS